MRSRYKIVFLGDQSVGKTTLTAQYAFNKIDNTYKPTIGIDFLTKKIEIDDKEIKLQIWDTAGQEKFNSIASGYARDSFLSIIVFDMTNSKSFLDVDRWINDIMKVNLNVKILIVGNKKDLMDEKELNESCARGLLKIKQFKDKNYDATYVSASALTLEGIKEMEEIIIKFVKEDIEKNEKDEEIKLNLKKSKGNRRCC